MDSLANKQKTPSYFFLPNKVKNITDNRISTYNRNLRVDDIVWPCPQMRNEKILIFCNGQFTFESQVKNISDQLIHFSLIPNYLDKWLHVVTNKSKSKQWRCEMRRNYNMVFLQAECTLLWLFTLRAAASSLISS